MLPRVTELFCVFTPRGEEDNILYFGPDTLLFPDIRTR